MKEVWLYLLGIDIGAWNARKHMPMVEFVEEECENGKQTNIMKGVWLFLRGIDFWNVTGAAHGLGGLPVDHGLRHDRLHRAQRHRRAHDEACARALMPF